MAADTPLVGTADPSSTIPLLQSAWRPGADRHGPVASLAVGRVAANRWEVVVGRPWLPPALRVHVELDRCGAWLTTANVERRPVVVRRAGWTDLRGHPAAPPGARWDRVGLGPGDAFVATLGGDVDEHDLLGRLARDLDGTSGPELGELVAAVGELDEVAVLVLRVPDVDADERLLHVVAGTGLPLASFSTPLHPHGDVLAPATAPRRAHLHLLPRPAAAPRARDLLRGLVPRWGLGAELAHPLELLTTELVTNAVVHARTELDVVVASDGRDVRVEVGDADGHLPAPLAPTPHGEGGRGLWLVEQLAEAWGVERTHVGKRVWFSLPVA